MWAGEWTAAIVTRVFGTTFRVNVFHPNEPKAMLDVLSFDQEGTTWRWPPREEA